MNETNNPKVIVFLDYVGRTILGELLEEKTETISVRNPVILHVVPADGGRMSIQLLPLFFREFLADKSGDVTFDFKKSCITETSVDALDFRLNAQYSQMFNKNNTFAAPQPDESNSPSVVKLFDE